MRAALPLLLLLVAVNRPLQQLRQLTKPDAEVADPFTNVTAVRELRDGRVIIIDPKDKVVQVVDFKAGTAKTIGREGSGPKEYGLPMALVALPGDTSLVYDPLNSRSLVVLPNGEPGDFFRQETQRMNGPGGGMIMSLSPPRYADAKGRLYTVGAGIRMTDAGPVTADSAPVTRYDRGTKATDTVAWIRQPKDNMQASRSEGRESIRIGGANPFSARDEWAVTPDGRVAVIRSPEYRVDWYGPVAKQGAPIAYEKLKVTEGHKQQWRDGRKNATAIMITNNNGRTTTRTGTPGSGGISIPEPSDWPELMPPFLDRAAQVAPDGRIWLSRTRDAKDANPKYDVIDGSGAVTMRVALPPKTRIVGLGNGTIYTIRTDEDDLQYLQRFRMP